MINIDRFIIALFESNRFNHQDKQIVRELLMAQGLEYKDGKILSARWCKCLKSCETGHRKFEKDKLYRYCAEAVANPHHFNFATKEELETLPKGED